MWHPRDETEACDGRMALLEWLRATGRWPQATPEELADFLAGHPPGVDRGLDALRGLAGEA